MSQLSCIPKKPNRLKRASDEFKQQNKKLKSNKPKYISEYISQIKTESSVVSNTTLTTVKQATHQQVPPELTSVNKENSPTCHYTSEQLWEEHCYTPNMPWLRSVENEGDFISNYLLFLCL